MAQRARFCEIDFITDHDCGNYYIGEIDSYPIYEVEEHINRFGRKGYESIRDFALRLMYLNESEMIKYNTKNSGSECQEVVKN